MGKGLYTFSHASSWSPIKFMGVNVIEFGENSVIRYFRNKGILGNSIDQLHNTHPDIWSDHKVHFTQHEPGKIESDWN